MGAIRHPHHCRHQSDPRLSEAGCARSHRRAAQIEQPGQRQADRVEAEINDQRGLRAAGRRDRLAEAAWDEVAADRTNRAASPWPLTYAKFSSRKIE